MQKIKLRDYGKVLTGREFGMEVWNQISETLTVPAVLDFAGVETMGSSFGDEVIPPVANAQGRKVTAVNVNDDIKETVEEVAKDASIVVVFG